MTNVVPTDIKNYNSSKISSHEQEGITTFELRRCSVQNLAKTLAILNGILY
jgi:hypothetical protein